ncbi:site-specific integrase [Mucilaginibacter sp. HMF5004]|uniref:site-specific integrase n=1 Tax=Mucilaginibacter rivuli TaxID=2857527 RepID=UPI001C606CED|nr:site-specific integrase [Mucilaginibacter rivuli]MBW4890114.1 site-specific integrase [Mucilaginibacter rivuli]
MATTAIVLKTSKKLLNNEFSVALRVTHLREPKYFVISTLVNQQSLKLQSTKEGWKPAEKEDNGLGKFRKSHPNYQDCNSLLYQKLSEANAILKSYDDSGIAFSFERFENDFKNKNNPIAEDKIIVPTVEEYYTSQILILEEQQREGLAGIYRENKSIIKKFKPNAFLSDINVRWLESFEYWMRNVRGNMDTTISVKMRNLQRLINQAIDDKLFPIENYPFGEKLYSINKRLDHKTKKLAIQLDKISKLKNLKLKPGSALHFAQQIMLFSYYCRGMNFIDITFLKWQQISTTHISYVRKKTGGKFEIPLNCFIKDILGYFKATYTIQDGYVFPIINPKIHITIKQKYTRKKTALKAVNDNLKKLAKLIQEPDLKLTTNVLRHSYATGLKRSGANVSHIKESLGHSTEFQTQTYLDEFETGVIESWELKMFEQ